MPGLRFSFPKAEINLTNRLQVRYTHEQFDDIRNPPSPLPSALEDKGSFRIRRMKTKFDGWIYTKELTFELQLNWPDTANPLEDANLDYDFTGGKKLIRLKAGQFKAPFSHQQLTSSTSQQLVDRSILDGFFVPARQIGVAGLGPVRPGRGRGLRGLADRRIQRERPDHDGQRQRRVPDTSAASWSRPGAASATRSPISRSTTSGYPSRGNTTTTTRSCSRRRAPATGTEVETFGASVVLKAIKSLFVYGQYFSGQSENAAGRRDRSGRLAVPGGLALHPKWEVAGRYAVIDPNTDTDNNDQTEWRAGVSWYMNKHNWKLQADYGQTENEAAAPTTFRTLKELRIQAQLIF